ncbi:MAG: DegV family protein [Clostridia bacterium]|nr:DegV family protein [Clostridia bacterium]
MREYIISCESTVDTNPERIAELGIPVVHLSVHGGDEHMADDMTYETALGLYNRMREGASFSTSQPAPSDYVAAWRPYLEREMDVLHISLSSAISGSINSARVARDQLHAEFGDDRIRVIDSLAASGGYGMLIEHANAMKCAGKTRNQLADAVEDLKLFIYHWFSTDEVKYLARSGRLSKGSAFIADVLQIKPVMNMDYIGRLVPREKTKGRKRALTSMAQHLFAEIDIERNPFIGITHSDCMGDVDYLISLIHERYPELPVTVWTVGAVVGCHTGPGVVALYFIAKEPRVN